MNTFRRTPFPGLRHRRGQGMTEYLIIVALIAVAAIGTFAFFGKTVRDQVGGLAQEVSGHANTGVTAANTDAKAAYTASQTSTKGLSDYNAGNASSEQ